MLNNQFNQLKVNEEELNRIFIEIYGLQDELTPEVEDKDITIRKAIWNVTSKALSPMQLAVRLVAIHSMKKVLSMLAENLILHVINIPSR